MLKNILIILLILICLFYIYAQTKTSSRYSTFEIDATSELKNKK